MLWWCLGDEGDADAGGVEADGQSDGLAGYQSSACRDAWGGRL